jgi:hypothetical protein
MLAERLGMTVYRLRRELGNHELAFWFEFYKRHPFGNEWYQTASIRAEIRNAAGKIYKGHAKPEHLMPRFASPTKQTPQQIWATAQRLFARIRAQSERRIGKRP